MINLNNYAQRTINFNGRNYLFVSENIMDKLYDENNECRNNEAQEIEEQIFCFLDKGDFMLSDLHLLDKSTALETEFCAEFFLGSPYELKDYFIYGAETVNIDFDFIVNWAPNENVKKGLDHLKIKALENYFKNN